MAKTYLKLHIWSFGFALGILWGIVIPKNRGTDAG